MNEVKTVRIGVWPSTARGGLLRPSKMLSVLVGLMLVLVACSGADGPSTDGEEEGSSTESEDSSEEDASGEDSTAPPEEEDSTATGGVVVFADSATDDSLDPAQALGFPRMGPLMLVYDRLIHLSPSIELQPGLATSWEFEDDTTLVLQLREGVTFHDGAPFNADAAVANLERSMSIEGAGLIQDGVSSIAETSARSEYVLEIVTTEPHSGLTFDLTGPAGMMISPEALENDDLDVNPVGTGMYTVTDFRVGDRVTYEANPEYWDPEAVKLDGFEVRFIPDANARLTSLETGDIDLTFIEARQVEAAESAGLTVQLSDTIQVWGLFLNLSRPDIENVAVRQAISQSIDRAQIIDGIFFGMGEPTVQFMPPGYYANSPDYSVDEYGFDVDRAQELMEEAGYSESNRASFSALIINRPEDIQIAEVLQQMLAQAYIDMEIQVGDPAQTGLFNIEQEVDALLGRWGGRPDPFITYEALFASSGSFNPGQIGTEEVDELMAEAGRTFDDDARQALAREVSLAASEAGLGGIPLFTRVIPYAESGCVVGFEPYRFGADEFGGVGLEEDC